MIAKRGVAGMSENESSDSIQTFDLIAHRAWVEKDPDLDSLREGPRFRNLPWRTTTGTEQHST